jgi:mRNA interferase MazF
VRRGELYRVYKPSALDPKRYRVFVVVSRQILIDSRFSTVICAPVYSSFDGLSTQVPVGTDQGLKHESSIHCDELVSIPKFSAGEEIIIARSGKPVAKLVPFQKPRLDRMPGSAKGKIIILENQPGLAYLTTTIRQSLPTAGEKT